MALTEPNPVLNESWLKRAAWWVSHRDQIKAIVVLLVIVTEAVLLVYSAYQWANYLYFGRAQQLAFEQALTDFESQAALNAAMAPQPITIASVDVLPGSHSANGYDVLVQFANPNPQWAATVYYRFSGATADQQTYILNNDQHRYVLGVGVASGSGSAPEVTITNVAWIRLKDAAGLNARKPNLVITNPRFTPGLGVSGSQVSRNDINQASFSFTNDSIDSFWSIGFMVILLNGSQPVAARYTTAEQVRTGETRAISITLTGNLGAVTSVEVVPDVNVLEPGVFMTIPGGTPTL